MIMLDGVDPREKWGLNPLRGHSNPATPDLQSVLMEIPGMPGAWDYGTKIGTRSFSIPFGKIEKDYFEKQRIIRDFVAFLMDPYGRPREVKMVFKYDSDKYYLVKLSGQFDPDRAAAAVQFTVPFVAAKPEAYFIVPSNQISWDSDIPFYNDILWGMDQTEFKIISPQTITIVYSGTKAIRAGFKLQGTGNNVKVSANGKTMTFGNMNSTTYEVDGETYTIKKNGVDSLVSTEFIELKHGENKVSISGSSLNLTFSEQLTYQFI